MQSELFTLDAKDFVRGIITAVLAGVSLAVGSLVTSTGFDLFSADWTHIWHLGANGAFAGFVGYIFKRLISDDDGKTLGNDNL